MKEILVVFGEGVKGLVKYPLASFLAFSIYVNIFLLTKLLALHETVHLNDQNSMHATDTAYHITITTLQNTDILKDTLLQIRDRQYRELLEEKKRSNDSR